MFQKRRTALGECLLPWAEEADGSLKDGTVQQHLGRHRDLARADGLYADFHLPRIRPTGEHLFICDLPPPAQ